MKLLKHIKSQAALEFLTTYGWAFLIILLMIGTLAYFGVLNPSKLLPSRCNFGAEFQCLDYQITTSTFGLRLKSNVGEPITLIRLAWETEATPSVISCTNTSIPTTGAPVIMNTGQIRDYAWTACSGAGTTVLRSGTKGKVLITLEYYETASSATYTKQVQGEVYSTVR